MRPFFLIAACSLLGAAGCFHAAHKAPGQAADKADSGSEEKAAPLKAEVTQAFFVGDELHVSVEVFARTELDPSKLLVRLVGLKQGAVAQTAELLASDLLRGENGGKEESAIDEGDSLLFRLSVPANELTEYQLQVSWGQDSSPRLEEKRASLQEKPISKKPRMANLPAKETPPVEDAPVSSPPGDSSDVAALRTDSAKSAINAPPSSGEALILTGNELEEETVACDKVPCDKRYAIRAQIQNASTQEISGIRLAVGIYFSAAGQVGSQRKNLDPLIEGEDVVDLKKLRLHSGEKKKLRIGVDRSVPTVPGGVFLPYVRLLDFKEK